MIKVVCPIILKKIPSKDFGGVVEVVVEGSLQLLLGIFLRIMGQTTFIITFSHVWVFLILITQFFVMSITHITTTLPLLKSAEVVI
jgi:hypothetical protein